MKRLMIWFTPDHCSIDIVRDTTHATSATDMGIVLKDLRPEDAELVRAFATAVLKCLDGDCKALAAIK